MTVIRVVSGASAEIRAARTQAGASDADSAMAMASGSSAGAPSGWPTPGRSREEPRLTFRQRRCIRGVARRERARRTRCSLASAASAATSVLQMAPACAAHDEAGHGSSGCIHAGFVLRAARPPRSRCPDTPSSMSRSLARSNRWLGVISAAWRDTWCRSPSPGDGTRCRRSSRDHG